MLSTSTLADLTQLAFEAAILAGKKIMEVYSTADFKVSWKDDSSPLTIADTLAHNAIVDHLADAGFPILSEEASQIAYNERATWDYYWLVDPLDGTKEFIRKSGEFTVNIALIHNSEAVAGVVYAPYLETIYYASKNNGAYKKYGTEIIRLEKQSSRLDWNELIKMNTTTIVASRLHSNEETAALINQFNSPNLTSMGSSLKFMLLAEGKANFYPRLAPTMEWDTAAAHAILNEVNKGVYTIDFHTELIYNKVDLTNPSFLAF